MKNYPHSKKRIQELAGINEISASQLKKMREQVAQELSQLQRIGVLSARTNAVERTIKGEFDDIIKDSMRISDAVDTITDLV